MKKEQIQRLLQSLLSGKATVRQVTHRLASREVEDLGFAMVDHAREKRRGFPEVIFCQNKTVPQIAAIGRAILNKGAVLLGTRLEESVYHDLKEALPEAHYCPVSKTLSFMPQAKRRRARGNIVIVTAGTSDIPVAEEAAVTAEVFGNRVIRIFDAGVAGIHRLFRHRTKLEAARVIIVVAGMEGALPSVVGGLVDVPVIAVPTSVGYGASFGGVAALLSMLNSCASGVTVVNIDNGFGAGYTASLINLKTAGK